LKFAGLKVTCCERLFEHAPGVKVMGRGKPAGIDTKRGRVSWNGNSGISALSLAYHLGARMMVLLGFDMHPLEDGTSNFHNDHVNMELHKGPNVQKVYDRYLSKMGQVKKDADRLGVKIVNATPGSSIKEFPIMSLEEVLNDNI